MTRYIPALHISTDALEALDKKAELKEPVYLSK
jgi:hypothetical protein